MKHSWTSNHNDDEENTDTRVKRPRDDREKACFAKGTGQRESDADDIKFGDLP